MTRYAVFLGFVLAVMLGLFGVVQALDVPFLADAEPLRRQQGMVAAMTGVTLLVIDVALPVPSSLVMVAHGAIFGIAAGTVVSMIGSLGAFGVAFALGRRGTAVVTRLVGHEDRQRADRLFRRWGMVAIILSRPFPMLAETVAFAAGGSSMGWRAALPAAALASVPIAAVYAIAGAAAASFSSGAVVFLAVAAVGAGAAVLFRPGRAVAQRNSP